MAILPPGLNRSHAVAYVIGLLRQQHGGILTFGIGGSCSDARFMSVCDYALVPRASPLAGMTLEML